MPMVNPVTYTADAAKNYIALKDIGPDNIPSQPDSGEFRTIANFSHMSFNDPIVFPGKEGAAHHHTFFGNVNADHNSTHESLRANCLTTAAGGAVNCSGYWAPSMIDTSNGTPIRPLQMLVYYKSGYTVPPQHIQAPPPDLRIIAGNMAATSRQENVTYLCGDTGYDAIPKNCGKGKILRMMIELPQCWDGKSMDSANHQSHMAKASNDYNTPNKCPASHPVALPVITLNVDYKIATNNTSTWRLSSDNYDSSKPGGYSAHADWMNGWNKDPKTGLNFLEVVVKNCLNKNKDCGTNYLGDGREMVHDYKW